jgi:hypothetical protein
VRRRRRNLFFRSRGFLCTDHHVNSSLEMLPLTKHNPNTVISPSARINILILTLVHPPPIHTIVAPLFCPSAPGIAPKRGQSTNCAPRHATHPTAVVPRPVAYCPPTEQPRQSPALCPSHPSSLFQCAWCFKAATLDCCMSPHLDHALTYLRTLSFMLRLPSSSSGL